MAYRRFPLAFVFALALGAAFRLAAGFFDALVLAAAFLDFAAAFLGGAFLAEVFDVRLLA